MSAQVAAGGWHQECHETAWSPWKARHSAASKHVSVTVPGEI